MIETVQHLATAGGIGRIRGLLNATTTFILAAMGDGRSYDDALREAQEAGYAEPDPTFDVTGRDAAQKIAILASVAWGRWRPEHEVATRGIVGIRVEPGETQRLVAEADEQGVRVGPMALGADDPMAGVSGIECLLEVQLREGAVFRLAGPGAGGPVSVRATYADLGTPAGRRASHPLRPAGGRVSDWPVVGVAGARGVVGGAFLSILADAGLPAAALRAFGSEEADRRLRRWHRCRPARSTRQRQRSWTSCSWPPMAPPRAQIAEGPGRAVPLIVDNSSAFRLDPQVPLVVPEANGHAIGRRAGNLVANPNCTTAAAVDRAGADPRPGRPGVG